MSSPDEQKERFGRFELISLLDEGIGGRLYRARDTEQDEMVLLKIVASSVSDNPLFGRYFYHRWADRQNMFEHPNVTNAQDVGKENGTYYIAMTEMEGQRLSDMLEDELPDIDQASEIIHQVAEALRAAHRRDMMHGYLTPSSVYLGKDKMNRDLVKVMFFDLAVAASESMVSVYGETVGAPKYMAPEVIRGGCVTPQSDIFSLGVISYELLTGKEPFSSDHVVGYLFSNCQKPVTPPHQANTRVPRELGMVVARMLEKEPERRYKNIQKVIDDLDRASESIKTGRVTVVPMGTDSAFERQYEIPEPEPRKSKSEKSFSGLNWAAVVLATIATLLAAYSLSGGKISFTFADDSPARSTSTGTGRDGGQMQQPGTSGGEQQAGGRSKQDQERDKAEREARAQRAFEEATTEAERFKERGAYDMAIATLKEVAATYEDTAFKQNAHQAMAKTYCEWGLELKNSQDFEQAAKKFSQAVETARKDSAWAEKAREEMPGVLASWAFQCSERGEYARALSIYERVQKDYPNSTEAARVENKEPETLYQQAWGLWKAQDSPEKALGKFKTILREHEKTEWAKKAREQIPPIQLAIAKKEADAGNHKEALQGLQELLEAYPESQATAEGQELHARVLMNLHEQAKENGDSEKAAQYFSELVEQHPDSPRTLRATRVKLELVPQPGETSFTNTTARSTFQEATNYYEDFKFERAINALKSVIRYTDPQSPIAADALKKLPKWAYLEGVHLYGLGREDEAKKSLKQANKTYSFSRWGRKADKVLGWIENPPEGMVFVPDGRFYMGTNLSEIAKLLKPHQSSNVIDDQSRLLSVAKLHGFASETPRHMASTEAFFIDKTEVTNQQYAEFVQATDHAPPSHWKSNTFPEGKGNLPVVNVSLQDARAYAAWADKRLPTEEEWEKAARGTGGRLYPWGDVFDMGFCHHMREKEAGPVPVGSNKSGASPYGCMDMIGNVLEWTTSWFQGYENSQANNPQYGNDFKVLRGGAWYKLELAPIPTRCASRYTAKPKDQKMSIGFRCVKDIKEE